MGLSYLQASLNWRCVLQAPNGAGRLYFLVDFIVRACVCVCVSVSTHMLEDSSWESVFFIIVLETKVRVSGIGLAWRLLLPTTVSLTWLERI